MGSFLFLKCNRFFPRIRQTDGEVESLPSETCARLGVSSDSEIAQLRRANEALGQEARLARAESRALQRKVLFRCKGTHCVSW